VAPICANCGQVPGADATAGSPCAGCGKPLTLPDAAFEAPVVAAAKPLEVDGAWEAERAAKQAPAPVKPPGRGGRAIVAALIVAAAAAGGIFYATRPSEPSQGSTVVIKILSAYPVEVRIDGHSAGSTPVTFRIGPSSTKHTLTTTIDGTAVARDFVADHNKVIDLSAK